MFCWREGAFYCITFSNKLSNSFSFISANGTSSEKKLAKKSTPSSTKTATPKTSSATKVKKEPKTPKKEPAGATASPAKGGRGKKKEEEKEVWKWWEEEPHPDGIKWVTLEHKVSWKNIHVYTC